MKTQPKTPQTTAPDIPAKARPAARTHTRNIYNRAWNSRISDDMRKEALSACRAAGLDQSDMARVALRWFLDLFHAAGDRMPSDIERRAVLAYAATVAAKVREIETLANPLVS